MVLRFGDRVTDDAATVAARLLPRQIGARKDVRDDGHGFGANQARMRSWVEVMALVLLHEGELAIFVHVDVDEVLNPGEFFLGVLHPAVKSLDQIGEHLIDRPKHLV